MAITKRISAALIIFLVVFTSFFATVSGQVLDIPPRLQWDNNNGYCGETSVQQIALYYGTYASQYRIREILDPTQQQDLWVETSGPVLDALRLTYEQWDYNQRTPQFRSYLLWTKQHIADGHPVIIAVYFNGSGANWEEAYDHIVPAIGAESINFSWYLPWDTLTFNDNYTPEQFTRYFSTLWATRLMLWNGLVFEYCIPRGVDYGCAVTGIRDDQAETLPVTVTVDRWDEPNLVAQEDPVMLNAQVTVKSVTPGSSYALLRYDTYNDVPVKNFLSSPYTSRHSFTATGATYTFSDQFMSDGVVIYRCAPAGN